MDLFELLRRVSTREEILALAAIQDEVEEAKLVLQEKSIALGRFAKNLERAHRDAILDIIPAAGANTDPAAQLPAPRPIDASRRARG